MTTNRPLALEAVLDRVHHVRCQLCRELEATDPVVSGAEYVDEWDEDRILRRLAELDRAVREVVRRFVAGQVTRDEAARLLAGLLPS